MTVWMAPLNLVKKRLGSDEMSSLTALDILLQGDFHQTKSENQHIELVKWIFLNN